MKGKNEAEKFESSGFISKKIEVKKLRDTRHATRNSSELS